MIEKQVIQYTEKFLYDYYDKNISSLFTMMHPDICWSHLCCQNILRGIEAVKDNLIQEQNQVDFFNLKSIHFHDSHVNNNLYSVAYRVQLDIIKGEMRGPIQLFWKLTFLKEHQQSLLYEVNVSLFESERQIVEHVMTESHTKHQHYLKAMQYEETLSLKQINDDLKLLTNNVPGGIFKCLYDKQLTILYMSEGFLSMFGYTRQDIKERFHYSFWEMIVPEDRELTQKEVQRQMALGKTKSIEYRVLHKDGHYVWVLDRGQLIEVDNGECPSFHCIMIDVTQEKKVEEELRLSLERYNIIMDQTNDVMFEWNIINHQVRFSKNWKNVFDNNVQFLGQNQFDDEVFKKMFHPQDVKKIDSILNEMDNGKHYIEEEIRLIDTQSQYHWWRLRLTVQFDKDEKPLRTIGIIMDIDEEKRRSQYLLHKSQQDALTGIYNKVTTHNLIKDYLLHMDKHEMAALMIIDIDNFKDINDYQGHLFGDAILSDIARRMKNSFHYTHIIGRIGGDEFVIFFKDIQSIKDIEKNAQKMIDQMELLEESHNHQLNISCSIGVAVVPQDGKEFTELFQKADRALYQAKNEGKKQYAIYNESLMREQLINMKSRSLINDTIDSNDHNRISGGQIAEYVFRALYNSSDVENAVASILEIVGLQFDVSRVYIFENIENDLYCCNTFEWCNYGVEPQIQMLKHVSYVEDLGGNYIDNFNENGIFYCPDIKKLPKLQYEILAPQNIKSMLQCAIQDNGVFKGYVGFDECRKNRYWTQEQIDALVFVSEILSVFLLKNRVEAALKQESEGLLNLLNNQSSWIYVIHPKTYEMLFINDKTKELCTQAQIGMTCYEAFMKKKSPCQFCPIEKIHGDCINQKKVVYNPHLKVWVDVDASQVTWQGQKAIMLSCHDITKYKKEESGL